MKKCSISQVTPQVAIFQTSFHMFLSVEIQNVPYLAAKFSGSIPTALTIQLGIV